MKGSHKKTDADELTPFRDSRINVIVKREKVMLDAGWGLTGGEQANYRTVCEAAQTWFDFVRLHPQEAREFLISQSVANALQSK